MDSPFKVEFLGEFESIFETALDHELENQLGTFGEITLDKKIFRYGPFKGSWQSLYSQMSRITYLLSNQLGTFGEITLDKKISRFCPFEGSWQSLYSQMGRIRIRTLAHTGSQDKKPCKWREAFSTFHGFIVLLI